MEAQSLRLRLLFEDRSVLSQAQRSEGMNRSWLLIEPQHHRTISDVCNHLLHIFNLRRSCPNGILLYMDGFVLPPSESTRILKDKEVICVKRKDMALAEAIDAADAYNLLDDGEVNRKEPVDNGMLLLANEEFDKEIGGYKSESEDTEEEKLEDQSLSIETVSKKRKASTKLRSSKGKKHRSLVVDDVEDEVAAEDDNISNDESLPLKILSKKIKQKKEKGNAETVIVEVRSPPKVKRKKRHIVGVVTGAEDEVVRNEMDNVNNGESVTRKLSSKKKIKTHEETKKGNDEKVKCSLNVKSNKHIQDNVEGVEKASTEPDGAKKVPSRSARRKKAKRQWRRELAKISQNPDAQPEPEVSKAENKEANGHPKELLKQDQVSTKLVHNNKIEQEQRNRNGYAETDLVPCVVRPGHIRFEPLDEDEDAKQIKVPDVGLQWNGITSKKKGQKWGLEKNSTSRRDDSQKTIKGSTMLTSDTEVPMVDLNDFDNLPFCSSPKEGDVIAYRVLELSSSWTPELSSFRVGKISYRDADDVVLMPVPDYPIVFDNRMDEDGPDGGPANSLYGEDGSLEIKFAALVDVRSLKESKSDATKAVSNGVNQTFQHGINDGGSNLMSSNDKLIPPKDPNPVNKEPNAWDELKEALDTKKSELLEESGEMTRYSGSNYRWSYRALRGSALGPTMAMLRSKNNI